MLSIISMRQITLDSQEKSIKFIDKKNAREAWIETKSQYMKHKGAFSRQNLLTYRRAWVKRHFIRSHLANLRG
jgi:hypothetical protein